LRDGFVRYGLGFVFSDTSSALNGFGEFHRFSPLLMQWWGDVKVLSCTVFQLRG
jgi:hypothetical protein